MFSNDVSEIEGVALQENGLPVPEILTAEIIVPDGSYRPFEDNIVDKKVNLIRRGMTDMQKALARSRKNVNALASIFGVEFKKPKTPKRKPNKNF